MWLQRPLSAVDLGKPQQDRMGHKSAKLSTLSCTINLNAGRPGAWPHASPISPVSADHRAAPSPTICSISRNEAQKEPKRKIGQKEKRDRRIRYEVKKQTTNPKPQTLGSRYCSASLHFGLLHDSSPSINRTIVPLLIVTKEPLLCCTIPMLQPQPRNVSRFSSHKFGFAQASKLVPGNWLPGVAQGKHSPPVMEPLPIHSDNASSNSGLEWGLECFNLRLFRPYCLSFHVPVPNSLFASYAPKYLAVANIEH
ncbi:hypothetical protein CCUS01_08732 [Colletotrichum cuscutae]|uniref:Uncharacterized protein n=1 Tax=Colletotrichum cuscutae TaxID=1209917 RepID=A0AAI9UNG3_9PEZI|nr:hypothetical protein CCUS01_08732 [Colletotrichum cuscutae]